jgi:hypothetical protein
MEQYTNPQYVFMVCLMKHGDNFYFSSYPTRYVKPEAKLSRPSKQQILKKMVHVMK